MGFAYRHSSAPADVIFTQALFQGRPGDQAAIQAEMERVTEAREAAQPIKEKTGGSTFKNPPGNKAWKLIDAAGCRGLVIGDAQVSEMHCNFLINRGNATAADIENLGEEVRRRVRENSGVELEWEIKQRIGSQRRLTTLCGKTIALRRRDREGHRELFGLRPRSARLRRDRPHGGIRRGAHSRGHPVPYRRSGGGRAAGPRSTSLAEYVDA